VAEFRLRVALDVNFHWLPHATLILNFFAGRTNGQQPAQELYFIESLLEFGDRLFQGSDVNSRTE
jgi:hypothetical protein